MLYGVTNNRQSVMLPFGFPIFEKLHLSAYRYTSELLYWIVQFFISYVEVVIFNEKSGRTVLIVKGKSEFVLMK